ELVRRSVEGAAGRRTVGLGGDGRGLSRAQAVAGAVEPEGGQAPAVQPGAEPGGAVVAVPAAPLLVEPRVRRPRRARASRRVRVARRLPPPGQGQNHLPVRIPDRQLITLNRITLGSTDPIRPEPVAL